MVEYSEQMTEPAMILAYVGPMLAVAGAAWRISSRLAHVDAQLKAIKAENARLSSDLVALRTLLSVIVDSRRATA
jgi:ApbE superfamily uncharacterized protein (UPF0280 family)